MSLVTRSTGHFDAILHAIKQYDNDFLKKNLNRSFISLRQRDSVTLFHTATRVANHTALKLLRDLQVSVNCQNRLGKTPLHIAVLNKDSATIKLLHTLGADVNIQDYEGNSPLIEACQQSDIKTIKTLLKFKEINIFIQNTWGYTARTILVFLQIDHRIREIPTDRYSEEVENRISLGHICCINKETELANRRFSLEMCYSQYFQRRIGTSLLTLSKMDISDPAKKKCSYLADIFKKSINYPTNNQIIKKINNETIFIFVCGWSGHILNLVFFKHPNGCHYMSICNRGENYVDDAKTIETYLINPKLIKNETIKTIYSQYYKNETEAGEYFYEVLPKELSGKDSPQSDFICETLKKIAPQPQKKMSNCAFSSPEAAIRASLFFLSLPKMITRNNIKSTAAAAINLTKIWSIHIKCEELTRYLNFHSFGQRNKCSPDIELVAAARSKIKKREKKLHRYSPYPSKLDERLKLLNQKTNQVIQLQSNANLNS